MKYPSFLPLGFHINNLSDSVQNKVVSVSREKPEKPIKLLWQVENKQKGTLFAQEKISALYLEVHISIGFLDGFSTFHLYLRKETGNQQMNCKEKKKNPSLAHLLNACQYLSSEAVTEKLTQRVEARVQRQC